MHATRQLLENLLVRASLTPHDADCQAIIAERLQQSGFSCRHLSINETSNLWATHGSGAPIIAFGGHTDVVPVGNEAQWHSPPFTPTERDGYLYARGAADMKSGVAAMVVALEAIIAAHPDHPGTLAILLTSDEEGVAVDGTKAVLPLLENDGIHIDYAIVGEPTCKDTLGDTARNGRRGSLHLHLSVTGKEGHVAYPEQVNNPIHALSAMAAELSAIIWDEGNSHFPPTTCQISNIHGGTGADNVVPETAKLAMNWRYNTEHTAESIKDRTNAIIARISQEYGVRTETSWRLSGEPFATDNHDLTEALRQAITRHTQQTVTFNTAGGTSDARFFAKHGAATVEFGPSNATIHKNNECVRIADLEPLTAIYRDSVLALLGLTHDA
ncbi:succinyl-diaminopimelate desuccinylase [Suttonella sp. R2A3]|uniref:succinyl-diaminopimelate desuccinylase n=1 Tax=Suttonella sp. R2A3 TaxID=2908648 RepID=UPI001F383E31|nr:succinyl-diaminopimelate desuccinylase [Suttonella sp. R2A3]UJF24921.1 succinyl-diaminopimelate desuccinylase [Suttonella sp. R2A3]